MTRLLTCLHCRRSVSVDDRDSFEPSTPWERDYGSPTPLGVSWVVYDQARNFALFSRHARRVWLQLYSAGDAATPIFETELQPLCNKTGPIWHCRLPLSTAPTATHYAYRVAGPGPGFDPAKILVDPYAKSTYFPPEFDRDAARRPGSNAGAAPLGLLDDCVCGHGQPRPAPRHGSELVIYEMHVRGFTCHDSSEVIAAKAGTFAGIVEKIPYLQQLGVTAVQWMPVFQFDPQEGNYWGYMPLSFFAVHQRYSTDPDVCAARQEFRSAVDALHDAGIEVFLDVVFNHTCEGDHRGPTYSYRGIDEATYYVHSGVDTERYANWSGTGNTLDTNAAAVRRLVLDSLRYWVSQMGVDGFRFDLASIFARRPDGSLDVDAPLFSEIAGDPVLARVRLIAEPWDADGANLLGRRFPGSSWMQWNAAYRDTVQRFVRGDPGMVPDLMTRLYGSSDLFPDDIEHAMRPFQSVNYVTSHDGFTLWDLVSYDRKHNWANGHGNADGHQDFSWNCGHEGDDGASDGVLQLRRRQAKNLLCLLMLSNGTPMLRMGDEFLASQAGNSNPYNQDNETSWLDWRGLEREADMFRFSRLLIAFRKTHPEIARGRYWRDDVRWHGPDGPVDLSVQSRCLGLELQGDDGLLYAMMNASEGPVVFRLPDGPWRRWIDTSLPRPHDIAEGGPASEAIEKRYVVDGRSVVVLGSPSGDQPPPC